MLSCYLSCIISPSLLSASQLIVVQTVLHHTRHFNSKALYTIRASKDLRILILPQDNNRLEFTTLKSCESLASFRKISKLISSKLLFHLK